MTYSYVARQPILDRNKVTIGYELLFRDGVRNAFPSIDAEVATSRLLFDQFLTCHRQLIEDKMGFVNFSYDSVIKQIPNLFPEKSIVVEILEDCEPTDELLQEFRNLKRSGYRIALDDFIPAPEWLRFLPYVDLIKIDIQQISIPKASLFLQKAAGTKIEFVAEKVETYDEFERALNVGFHYFQGYFFSKPEVIEKKRIVSSMFTVIELCKCISEESIDYSKVEELVSSDVTLSYKLLYYVNSCASIKVPISSFRQALSYLGEDKLRQFVSAAALTTVGDNKPDSLYNLSIQRGRFCELLISELKGASEGKKGFLTGIFSLLDSLLDQSLDSVIDSIPIDNDIKAALLHDEGLLGDALKLAKALETADWPQVTELEKQMSIPNNVISSCYKRSIRWTDEVFSG